MNYSAMIQVKPVTPASLRNSFRLVRGRTPSAWNTELLNDRSKVRRANKPRLTMFMESSLTQVDSGSVARQQQNAFDCTFWTGRDGGLSVQHFRPVGDIFYPPHSHSEYTAMICLAGEITVKQLNHEQTISPGEALIVNLGVEHSCRYQTKEGRACESVAVAMDPRLMAALTVGLNLPGVDDQTCPVFLGKCQGPVIQDCAREICAEMTGRAPGHKVIIETMAIRLLVEVFRSWPRTGIQLVATDSTPRLSRREFVRAYEFMRGCRKEDFRLQNLCRSLGMSMQRFTRLFFASTRQTPASFYNRLMLAQACALLRNPELSVKEIGFELGFKTSSHFTASFRREHKVSPQEFRQRVAWGQFDYSLEKNAA